MTLMKQLTVKDVKYLDAYVKTGTLEKAGLEIRPGINKSTAASNTLAVTSRGNVIARMEQVFDSVGLTEHAIAQKLKDKSDAKRQIFFSNRGIVVETKEVEDNHTQLKAVEMAARLRGMDIQRHANLNINMTADDLKSLQNSDLDSMLRQCDNELEGLQE